MAVLPAVAAAQSPSGGASGVASDLQGQHPMVLVLSRGGFCPKDRRQAEGLLQLHRELEVGYCGSPIEIGFNARYLLDITAQLQGTEAEFKLADAASPTLLGDAADSTALYVLMPMRV